MKREIPKKYRKLYKIAMNGRSRQAAMRMFCLECVGYVIEEVGLCIDPGCPLYPYRVIDHTMVSRRTPWYRQKRPKPTKSNKRSNYGKETQTQKSKGEVGQNRRSRLGEKTGVDAPYACCLQRQSFETNC